MLREGLPGWRVGAGQGGKVGGGGVGGIQAGGLGCERAGKQCVQARTNAAAGVDVPRSQTRRLVDKVVGDNGHGEGGASCRAFSIPVGLQPKTRARKQHAH